MKKTLIGFDFSINKPAACILNNNKFTFISWPYNLSNPQKKVYNQSPVTIIDREDNKEKGKDSSEKFRYQVKNSKYLASLILNSIYNYLDNEVFLAFEGLSYGSTGDVVVQLGGYKYMLMDLLSKYIPLENMFTYAPITIKKTAGCSQKGSTKSDMIEAFKMENTTFSKFLKNNESLFKTHQGNWIAHLDDIVDSYWALRTLQDKEF